MALEISGFVIGLSNVIPVVDKSFQIWRSISKAKSFGSDLIGIAAQLSMEYYRFLAWARISQALQPPAGEGIHSTAPDILSAKWGTASFPLSDNFSSRLQAPILDAASRIVSTLEEVSKIAEKYAITDDSTTPEQQKPHAQGPGTPKSLAQGLSTVLPIVGVPDTALASVMAQHRQSASTLQKRSSFRVKLSFVSKPWGQPDKKFLEDKVKELSYWNDRLEGLLPQALRNTIEHQAIPGQILLEENKALLDDLIKASEHQNKAVRTHAKLWKERIEFSMNTRSDPMMLESYRRVSTEIAPVSGLLPSRCELSLATLKVGGDGKLSPYNPQDWTDLQVSAPHCHGRVVPVQESQLEPRGSRNSRTQACRACSSLFAERPPTKPTSFGRYLFCQRW
jgi:hypothetical protein